jgi:catechol 2,3-dioxygenase-like lactoylglutathione lyase family enzyme
MTVQYRSPDGIVTANARTPSPDLAPDSNNYYQQQEQHCWRCVAELAVCRRRATSRNSQSTLRKPATPVADVDRAKEFYCRLGWRLDIDQTAGENFRRVQLTPRGKECSIQFGTNITSAAPGSVQDLFLIVSDIGAAHAELVARRVEASEVFHERVPGARFHHHGANGRVSGPSPEHASYGSFVSFSDPDGNGWLLQEFKTRLPGRADPAAASYASASDLGLSAAVFTVRGRPCWDLVDCPPRSAPCSRASSSGCSASAIT